MTPHSLDGRKLMLCKQWMTHDTLANELKAIAKHGRQIVGRSVQRAAARVCHKGLAAFVEPMSRALERANHLNVKT
jgi:hypothetical protein